MKLDSRGKKVVDPGASYRKPAKVHQIKRLNLNFWEPYIRRIVVENLKKNINLSGVNSPSGTSSWIKVVDIIVLCVKPCFIESPLYFVTNEPLFSLQSLGNIVIK